MSKSLRSAPREIVRHAAVLAGRWHLDGTTLAVAEIRSDYESVPNRADASYHYPTVTADELTAILAFPFPVIRPTEVNFLYGAFVVACECGEDTPAALTDIATESIRCICGRRWWIRISFERDGEAAFDGQAPH